jgi:hypothetical protein
LIGPDGYLGHLKLDFGPDCRGISKPFKSFQNCALGSANLRTR